MQSVNRGTCNEEVPWHSTPIKVESDCKYAKIQDGHRKESNNAPRPQSRIRDLVEEQKENYESMSEIMKEIKSRLAAVEASKRTQTAELRRMALRTNTPMPL